MAKLSNHVYSEKEIYEFPYVISYSINGKLWEGRAKSTEIVNLNCIALVPSIGKSKSHTNQFLYFKKSMIWIPFKLVQSISLSPSKLA